ncbi:MAG TPA: dihydrolipoamide acetyltransferase family protein [Chloroflexota bacterium]
MPTTRIIMPAVGQTTAEGTIVAWLKAEGERIERGDLLAEVETDKTSVPIEAFAAGFLRRIVRPAPAVVEAGETIALMTTTADEPLAPEPEAAGTLPTDGSGADGRPAPRATAAASGRAHVDAGRVAAGAAPIRTAAPLGVPGAAAGRVLATPMARQVAAALGVDLARVLGSGPGGRILEADVRAQAGPAPVRPLADEGTAGRPEHAPADGAAFGAGEDEYHELTPLRRAIATRMARSAREAPQFALSIDVDLTAAERAPRRSAASGRAKPAYTALLVKAVALALRRHPEMNAAFEEGRVRRSREVNVGVAMATSRGLLVPVVRGADALSLEAIRVTLDRLKAGAEAGRLPPDALSGGTFTISNLGMFGVDRFTAILNPPEAGILAVGRIGYRPVALGPTLESRVGVTLTLTVDHRVLDGAEAAGFLGTVRRLLEDPSEPETSGP